MIKDTMLLFDLDGTLWDAAKEVADSWNIILKKYAVDRKPLDAAQVQALMGKTMQEISDLLLPDLPPAERTGVYEEMQTYENIYIRKHGGTLFPGIREALKTLHEAGYQMGIVSNCQVGYIGAFLTSMKMWHYFCDIEAWGYTKKSKGESIHLVIERNAFSKAIYIGDISRDMDAAHEAGIPFIHAAYGFGTVENPDGVIHTPQELPAVVKNMTMGHHKKI